jgi:membrane-bound lytic murein transglycosylase B
MSTDNKFKSARSAKLISRLRPLLLWAAMLPLMDAAAAPSAGQLSPEIETFIQEMVQKHQFSDVSLRQLFARVEPNPAVISAISAPLTALPWHEFRRRYLDSARINGGVVFWREHAATLARARREFGVPEEIIVATIGVETTYGRHTGRFGVLEALSMLAFHYPPRAQLFRSELAQYLLLAREARIDATSVKGSYAGAIGIPQFLPSSYRRYAVDFDGDGKRDLVKSTADAIGSVANYYKSHGWRAGETIAVPAEVVPGEANALLELGVKPQLKVSELKRRGVSPAAPVEEGPQAALIMAESENGPSYWLGLNNFYVITRYNRSINYALVVDELARELRARFQPED